MFKRNGSQNWHSKVKTPSGKYKEQSWGTSDKPLARKMEAMWHRLAEQRRWDVLQGVLNQPSSVGELYDVYKETKGSLDAIMGAEKDVDLAELLPNFLSWYRASGVVPATADIVETHVRWLIGYRRDPKTRQWMLGSGPTLRLSSMTPAYLNGRLSEYAGTPATRRRVHFAWSMFSRWMVSTSIVATSPLTAVTRPKLSEQPVKFYELKDVLRIIEKAPSDELKSLWAFMYGTGAEISPTLVLTKADVDSSSRSVRVVGTKTHARDRRVRISDWAWPLVESAADGVVSAADCIWPKIDRWRASKAHRDVVAGLGLPNYPLYNARHHWAATRLRAGWPLAMVQAQLGHSRASTTLNVYGRFMPSAGDFDRWEASMVETSTGDESEAKPSSMAAD